MAISNPPAFLQAGVYPAALDRLHKHSARFLPTTLSTADVAARSGLLGGQSGRQANASMTNWDVNVGRFAAIIENTFGTQQGDYSVFNDATQTVSITPSSPTTNRIDIIGVRVQDAFYTGVLNQADIAVVQGTPAAGTPAAPALPASFMPLWQVTVNAATSTGVMLDLRKRTAMMGSVYSPFANQVGDGGTMVGEMQILPAAGVYPSRLRFWDGAAWRGVTPFQFDKPAQTGSGTLPVGGNGVTIMSVAVADPGYPFRISAAGSLDWAVVAASSPNQLIYCSVTLNSIIYNVGAITTGYELSESLGASFSQPNVAAIPSNTATQAAGSAHTVRLMARNSGASSYVLPLNGPSTTLWVQVMPA